MTIVDDFVITRVVSVRRDFNVNRLINYDCHIKICVGTNFSRNIERVTNTKEIENKESIDTT